ncbi:hypothetical protein Q3G72_035505 [Acer saccharum]|nr:hypothetical protein Q3G72_035505 [Acer saccharum]
MGSTRRSGAGTSRCHCTTPDTPKLTMSPCLNGSLIVCLNNTAYPSLEMLTRRESSPWELSSGLIKNMYVLVFLVYMFCMLRSDSVLPLQDMIKCRSFECLLST